MPDWRERLAGYLKRAGEFDILTAGNRDEASQLLADHTFQLVILDINLSDVAGNVDGLYLGNEIWRKSRATKIIIVTGSENATKYRNSFQFVPNYILTKQYITRRDFINKVQQAMAQESFADYQ